MTFLCSPSARPRLSIPRIESTRLELVRTCPSASSESATSAYSSKGILPSIAVDPASVEQASRKDVEQRPVEGSLDADQRATETAQRLRRHRVDGRPGQIGRAGRVAGLVPGGGAAEGV